jgi:hypothetical protein
MNQDRIAIRDQAVREIMTHLAELNSRCLELLSVQDPLNVYNHISGLRSLVGQIDSATKRWRELT